MAYATPADFVQAFGLHETCMLLTDEERQLTEDALTSGLEALAQGGAVADATAARALERLRRRLASTSSLMNSYLSSAIKLPITSTHEALLGVLQDCCLALTRCAISDDPDNATERMDKACDNWRQWLKDVAAGKINLIDPDDTSGSGRVITGQAPSAYNWGMYHGFGGGYRP